MNDEALQAIRKGNVAVYVAIIENRAGAVSRRLPKPDGSEWTPDDVEDLTSSFYESAAYEHSLLTAHDDDSLSGLVYTGLANLVRGELRRTARGRLHRRLRELLRAEDFFERPTKFWRRGSDPDDASISTVSELMEAAWSVDVRQVKWRADAKRNSPIAETTSLIELLDAIFDVASGALHIDVLVDVLGSRLGIGPTSAIEALDLVEDLFVTECRPGPAEQLIDQESELDAAITATELWNQLSPRERELVPHLASSVRQAAGTLGRKKSSVHEAMKRLKEKIGTVLRDEGEEARASVVRELLAHAGGMVDS